MTSPSTSILSSYNRHSRRRLAGPALALTLGLVVAACGDTADEGEDAAGDQTTTSTTEDHGGENGDDETIAVRAVDYAFVGVPTSVEAGSELTLSNDSEGEVHEIVLFKLPDDEERPLPELLALSEEEVGQVTGPPVGVSFAFPGEDGMVVDGDLTVEDPGRYVMICAIPTGADPQAYRDALAAPTPPTGPPDVPGGAPHFTQGMVAEFTVS